MSLLSVEKLGISFGGIRALDSVSFELNRGEILGLIGPNGAGKTTLFNCISGVLTPDHGAIRYEGRNIHRLKAHERAQRGIARTFQDLQLWGSMTVLENCQLPIDALSRRSMIADALRLPAGQKAEMVSLERARAVLHVLDLLPHADTLAGDLPVGLQRRVEMARALSMKPQLILLDEPASGLDAGETAELAQLLATIRDRFKVSMLLVDHDMSLVMRACHFIYVLDFGEMISSGRPEQVRDDPKVITAYLGETKPSEVPKPKARGSAKVHSPGTDDVAEPGEVYRATDVLLDVSNLSGGYGGIEIIRQVSLKVGRGEVVACIGANGAGKTTTLRAISGVIKPAGGKVVFDGVDITGKSPESIVAQGLIHIPQGRGLFPKLTVEETLRLAAYSGHAGDDFEIAYNTFPVLRKRSGQFVGTLSGGEQQMVAMARALLVKPKLLLLDEMSQGLAPTIVLQLFERINQFREQGTAVLLVEQFVDSALGVADRAYIFEHGTVTQEGTAARLRQDQTLIASSYLGSAVDVVASVVEDGVSEARLLEDMAVKLPAEIKRSLEERAVREGRPTDELVRQLLGSKEGIKERSKETQK
jgi:branched-chain amino acid transport system ATP-binding protein